MKFSNQYAKAGAAEFRLGVVPRSEVSAGLRFCKNRPLSRSSRITPAVFEVLILSQLVGMSHEYLMTATYEKALRLFPCCSL